MGEPIKIEQAGMMNSEELVLELSDGRTVKVEAEEILSLHPPGVHKRKSRATHDTNAEVER